MSDIKKMIYSVYDPITGQILSTIFDSTDSSPNNSVPGNYNDQEHYVDIETKNVIFKSSKPTDDHLWDINSKTWIVDNTKLPNQMRKKRNQLLSVIDKVNLIWYSSLSVEQQTQLQNYRTALLNVPQQDGFPNNINWPSKPSWLS